MIALIPVTPAGLVEPRFGKAPLIALADVDDSGAVAGWEVVEVGWDVSHDAGTHGSHHARIVRVLRERGVDMVVAAHIGDGMRRTLAAMQLPVVLGAAGPAREAVISAVELVRGGADEGPAD